MNRSEVSSEYFDEILGLTKLDSVLKNSDIIVLTIALTKETEKILNEHTLTLLKEGAVVVNVSRGGVIDTNALKQVSHKLGGIILDVFDEEPLKEQDELWDMENVVVYPHNSFVGEKNEERLQQLILNNLRKIN